MADKPKSVTDVYAEQMTAEAAEARLKAQRLNDLHAWLHGRYLEAYKAGDVINETATARTLYYIETGLKPEDNREAADEFEEHLRESAQSALEY